MDQKEAFALKREHGAEHLLGTGVKFDRTRRITGYLVGSLERFNNAKRAEERERVKHGAGESVTASALADSAGNAAADSAGNLVGNAGGHNALSA